MREHPLGSDLLLFAREILRKEVLPTLPSDQKINALMIANAMKICARQLQNGDENNYTELAALENLINLLTNSANDNNRVIIPINSDDKNNQLISPVLSQAELQKHLLELNRKLAKMIRKRELSNFSDEVFNHIQRFTAIRAAESSG